MNKYEALEIRDFNGFSDFFFEFEKICRENDFDDYYFVSVYAGREFIYTVLMEFMRPELIDKWEVGSIDFVSRDIDGADYDREYCLYVNGDGLITVDFARDDVTDIPYGIADEIAFVYQEDCGQDIIDEALCNNANKVTLFGTDADPSVECATDVKVTTFWANQLPKQSVKEAQSKINDYVVRFNNILSDIDRLEEKIGDLMVDVAKCGA